MIGGDLSTLSIVEVVVFAIIIGIIALPFFIPLTMLVGPLWAPFAALACAIRAPSIGRSRGRYAAIGAVYTTLFLLPWIYLIARMYGMKLPEALLWTGYIVLYVVWFCSIVLNLIVAFASHPGKEHLWDFTNVDVIISMMVFTILCVNATTWVVSMVRLYSGHQRSELHPNSEDSILPNRAYILPFLFALLWLVVPWLIIWMSVLYEGAVGRVWDTDLSPTTAEGLLPNAPKDGSPPRQGVARPM